MTVALAIGSAESLWADVDAALDLGEFDAVVACNDAASVWRGPLAAVASYHPERWPAWLERRRRAGIARPARVFGHDAHEATHGAIPGIEYTTPLFPGQIDTGSSGLFAVKVALVDLGFDKVVACGVPLDERPHFYDAAQWRKPENYHQGWRQALPQIRDRVRSMSGFTAELLGLPTEEWLANSHTAKGSP